MIHTETNKAKILLVEVPMDIIAYGVHHAMDGDKRSFRVASETDNYELCLLPQGNWTLLNTLDAVTEDEAERVVEEYQGEDDDQYIPSMMGFKNYEIFPAFSLSATESLHSLATSLGINEGKWVVLYQFKN